MDTTQCTGSHWPNLHQGCPVEIKSIMFSFVDLKSIFDVSIVLQVTSRSRPTVSTIGSNDQALTMPSPSSSSAEPGSSAGSSSYLPTKGKMLRVLTATQNTSALVFSVFLGVHMVSPIVAAVGGIQAADRTMVSVSVPSLSLLAMR